MEIGTRQLERLLTCTILLEEACEKNNVALRAVNLIREVVDEIEADAGGWDDLDEEEIPERRPDVKEKSATVRAYGQELLTEGCGMKNLIRLTMEHFGMTQTAFANLIGVNQGNLSGYLKHGFRRKSVLEALAEFFGFDGGAGTETEEE